MIKINLSTEKKQVDISNIGGVDLTRVKIKALILVIGVIYLPDIFLVDMWEEERKLVDDEITSRQRKLSDLKRKVAMSKDLEKQIMELKAQEENLSKKLTAVKQAISEKRNPAPILLYIAKNMPPELWIKELDLTPDQMTIKGEALDYTSIGNFVQSMRSSVFIRDASISGTSSIYRPQDKRRIETFEVVFSIARFDQ